MLEQLQGLHIEPTNICTLKCPRCARTKFIDKFPTKWKNKNLNLDDLKNFIDIDLKNKIISLNGNYGDPMYHPEIIKLVEYLKLSGARIILHTNGSYISDQTWQALADLVDENDIVNFSIDGIPENFIKYRINADWESIERGIKIMVKSQAKVIWKYIVFSYNIDSIEQAKKISQDLKMDDLIYYNSDRWDGVHDWLNPKKHIKTVDTIKNGILPNGVLDGQKTEKKIYWNKVTHLKNEIDPFCKKNNSEHFISADGYYMPCCRIADFRFYYRSDFYKNQSYYDIKNITISKVFDNLKNFFNNIEQTKFEYCTFNCPKL